MRLELPAPDTTRLEKSPLQLVVCQVRFEDIPSVTDPRLALAIHGRLGGREGPYPILEQLKGEQLEVTLGIGGSPIATQTSPLNGWRLFSQGRDWIVSLLPGSVSLETTAYTIWDGDFNSRLASLLDAVSEELRPALEQRLGLRYVDLLTEPEVTSPVGWQGWVETKFLGPILHERNWASDALRTAAARDRDWRRGSMHAKARCLSRSCNSEPHELPSRLGRLSRSGQAV